MRTTISKAGRLMLLPCPRDAGVLEDQTLRATKICQNSPSAYTYAMSAKRSANPPEHVLRAIAEAKLTPVSAGNVRITEEDKRRAAEHLNTLLEAERQKQIAVFAKELKALAAAGPDSWVVFSDADHTDNYVQFTREPAICEVSSRAWEGSEIEPLNERDLTLLEEQGFAIPAPPFNPETSVDYEDVQALAELVEWLFADVLDCGGLYEVEVEKELVEEKQCSSIDI